MIKRNFFICVKAVNTRQQWTQFDYGTFSIRSWRYRPETVMEQYKKRLEDNNDWDDCQVYVTAFNRI